MTPELLENTIETLRELMLYKFEKQTENSCTNRQDWTDEQRMEYADRWAFDIYKQLLEQQSIEELKTYL